PGGTRARPRLGPLDGVVRLAEQPRGLLHRASGPGQAALVDRELGAAGVDRLAEALDGEVGQLLADGLQPLADVVELAGHGALLVVDRRFGGAQHATAP